MKRRIFESTIEKLSTENKALRAHLNLVIKLVKAGAAAELIVEISRAKAKELQKIRETTW